MNEKIDVDMILYNGRIYTSDADFNQFEAIAISGDSIVALGTSGEIQKRYHSTESIDLEQRTVFPGFIDAHCHFFAYGQDLQELDLKQTVSFDDMINQTVSYAQANNPSIVVGRGWNEENWESKSTPSKYKLDALFPQTPVVLQRIDGHAVLCNQAALDLAGIDENTQVQGGMVVKMGFNLTGMLVDKAADLVLDLLPEISLTQKINALQAAERACFRAGLTTVSDAGLSLKIIQLIDSLQKAGELNIRVYAMSNPDEEELNYFFESGPILSEKLIVRSIKLYADGSLGSRGALLKQPYCDEPSIYGLLQSEPSYYTDIMKRCLEHGFQVNTHCIGDSANAMLLNMYGQYLKGVNDLRWRIEHAQVVDPKDRHLFKDFSIIPSVQPTHATSDMYMARERLCLEERLAGAYSYKSLLSENQMIAFGTDFPVENISPIETYFAATNRIGKKGEAFRVEEAITPKNAIMAMTAWAAHANFMESFTGSLEIGKKADLIVLSNDITVLKTKADTKNLMTVVDGKIVYNSGLVIEKN